MPELPEVESISNAVKKVVLGKKVTSIDIHRDKLRWELDKKTLKKLLTVLKLFLYLEGLNTCF